MIRSAGNGEGDLSELVELAPQDEEILITANGKERTWPVGVAVHDFVEDITGWRRELIALNLQYVGRGTAMAKVLDDVREDRF